MKKEEALSRLSINNKASRLRDIVKARAWQKAHDATSLFLDLEREQPLISWRQYTETIERVKKKELSSDEGISCLLKGPQWSTIAVVEKAFRILDNKKTYFNEWQRKYSISAKEWKEVMIVLSSALKRRNRLDFNDRYEKWIVPVYGQTISDRAAKDCFDLMKVWWHFENCYRKWADKDKRYYLNTIGYIWQDVPGHRFKELYYSGPGDKAEVEKRLQQAKAAIKNKIEKGNGYLNSVYERPAHTLLCYYAKQVEAMLLLNFSFKQIGIEMMEKENKSIIAEKEKARASLLEVVKSVVKDYGFSRKEVFPRIK